MNLNSLLYIYILLSGFFFASSVLAKGEAALSKETPVLVNNDGELEYGVVVTHSVSNDGKQDYVVQVSGYNQKRIRVSKTQRHDRSHLILPKAQIDLTLQNRIRTIQKGTVVLGSGKKIYIVEDVFENGKLVVKPLAFNLNSKNRVSQSFARVRRSAFQIIDQKEIVAVEVPAFGRYKKGALYNSIAGLPVCDAQSLKTYQLPPDLRDKDNLHFICGRSGRGALMHGIFSDGTMVMGSNIFNPFPSSFEKYVPSENSESEPQSQF